MVARRHWSGMMVGMVLCLWWGFAVGLALYVGAAFYGLSSVFEGGEVSPLWFWMPLAIATDPHLTSPI